MNQKIIYLDMDGVIADFIGAVGDLFGKDVEGLNQWSVEKHLKISSFELWARIDQKGISFWEGLNPYPWTEDLISLCYDWADDVYICTSPSRSPTCVAGKMKWIYRHLPSELHRKFFLTPHKHHLARSNHTVLIDDSDRNIEKFNQWGGKGLIFPQGWNNGRTHKENPLEYIQSQLL